MTDTSESSLNLRRAEKLRDALNRYIEGSGSPADKALCLQLLASVQDYQETDVQQNTDSAEVAGSAAAVQQANPGTAVSYDLEHNKSVSGINSASVEKEIPGKTNLPKTGPHRRTVNTQSAVKSSPSVTGSDLFEILTGKMMSGFFAAVLLIIGFILMARIYSFGVLSKFCGMMAVSAAMSVWGCTGRNLSPKSQRARALVGGIGFSLFYTTVYCGCFIFKIIPEYLWFPSLFLWSATLAWIAWRRHPVFSALAQFGIVLSMPVSLYSLSLSAPVALAAAFAAQFPFHLTAFRSGGRNSVWNGICSALLMFQYLNWDTASVHGWSAWMVFILCLAAAAAAVWHGQSTSGKANTFTSCLNILLLLETVRLLFCTALTDGLTGCTITSIPGDDGRTSLCLQAADGSPEHPAVIANSLCTVLMFLCFLAVSAIEYISVKLRNATSHFSSVFTAVCLTVLAFNLDQLGEEHTSAAIGFLIEIFKNGLFMFSKLTPFYGFDEYSMQHLLLYVQFQYLLPLLAAFFCIAAVVKRSRNCACIVHAVSFIYIVPCLIHQLIIPDSAQHISIHLLMTVFEAVLLVQLLRTFSVRCRNEMIFFLSVPLLIILYMITIRFGLTPHPAFGSNYPLAVLLMSAFSAAAVFATERQHLRYGIAVPVVWAAILYYTSLWSHPERGLIILAVCAVLLEVTRRMYQQSPEPKQYEGYKLTFYILRIGCLAAVTIFYLTEGSLSGIQKTAADSTDGIFNLYWICSTMLLIWFYFNDLFRCLKRGISQNEVIYYGYSLIAVYVMIMMQAVNDWETRTYLFYPLTAVLYLCGYLKKSEVLRRTSVLIFCAAAAVTYLSFYRSFATGTAVLFTMFVYSVLYLVIMLEQDQMLKGWKTAAMYVLAVCMIGAFCSQDLPWFPLLPAAIHMIVYRIFSDHHDQVLCQIFLFLAMLMLLNIPGTYALNTAVTFGCMAAAVSCLPKENINRLYTAVGLCVCCLPPVLFPELSDTNSFFGDKQELTAGSLSTFESVITCSGAAAVYIASVLRRNFHPALFFTGIYIAAVSAVHLLLSRSSLYAELPKEPGDAAIFLLLELVLCSYVAVARCKIRSIFNEYGLFVLNIFAACGILMLCSDLPAGFSSGTVMCFAALCLAAVNTIPTMLDHGGYMNTKWFYIATKSLILLAVFMFVLLETGSLQYTCAAIAVALLYLASGLLLHRQPLRIAGLIYAALFIFKLIFIDINYRSELIQAVSYIGAGILLLVISLVYNYIRKNSRTAGDR